LILDFSIGETGFDFFTTSKSQKNLIGKIHFLPAEKR
jgi:hypothetical protein